jgi:hypothetical protein
MLTGGEAMRGRGGRAAVRVTVRVPWRRTRVMEGEGGDSETARRYGGDEVKEAAVGCSDRGTGGRCIARIEEGATGARRSESEWTFRQGCSVT